MSGLNHDFMLLSRKEHPIEEWQRFHHNPDAVKIHDDALRYMGDTLKWIPTYIPATKRTFQGLCWYGPTIILEPGAEVAAKIFSLSAKKPLRDLASETKWLESRIVAGEPKNEAYRCF